MVRLNHAFHASSYVRLWFVALVCFTFFSVAYGQTNVGRISGTVKDTSGGVIPGVTLTVTNEATRISRSVVTDDNGNIQMALKFNF